MKIYVQIHRGGGGGDSPGGTTVQAFEPPEYIEPFYEDALSAAERLSRDPREQFPHSTVVPFSPETEAGLAGITARSLAGSPLTNAAQAQQLATIGGAYLDPVNNPAYQSVVDAVSADIIPEAYTSFASGGQHFGSPVEAESVSRGLGRGLAPFAFGHYGQERVMQEAASQYSPTLSAVDYRDLQALVGVGAAREDLSTRQLQEAIDRWTFDQEEPRVRLGEYISTVFGAPVPGFNASTQQFAKGGSPLTGALGGALSGAASGAMIGSVVPGIGTGIGALAGALMGGAGGGFMGG